jgi:hypothetical protein
VDEVIANSLEETVELAEGTNGARFTGREVIDVGSTINRNRVVGKCS